MDKEKMTELEKKVGNPPKFCSGCQKIFDKYWKGLIPSTDAVFEEMTESSDRHMELLQKLIDKNDAGEEWKKRD